LLNPYFWLFALLALLMTPVRAQISLWINHGVYWQMQLLISGIPVVRRQKKARKNAQEAVSFLPGLFTSRRKLAWTLWREGSLAPLWAAFGLEALDVQVHLSFADAAQTALGYAFLCTVLETLARCRALPMPVRVRLQADFHAQGTQMTMEGIFSARLGRIVLAGARLGIAVLRTRARLATEEEQYAASH